MNCALSTISNHTKGFDFGDLFNVYLYLNQTCPSDSDIFFPGSRMLTEPVCRKITGNSSSIWSGWTPYPISDIWTRIVTWKVPLFQLVSQFPRPPLGAAVETATLVHLLGDPIDSFMNMFLTLAKCDARAKLVKKICSDSRTSASRSEYRRIWKSLAIIMVSYDECGLSPKAHDLASEYGELRQHADFEEELRHIYDETAYCLAADRQTKTLPIAIAETIFVAGWLLALLKAASSEPNPTNWVNVEAQSVAISALYLWVTSAVGIAAVIGASQSEGSIPRLLQRFEYDMTIHRGHYARRPSAGGREEIGWCKTGTDRAVYGGLYSWRPTKWRDLDNCTLAVYALVATMAVGSSFLTAAILSYLIPPKGLCCRHIPESVMFVLWLMSSVIGSVLERWLRKGMFWAVFWKDMFFSFANISVVLITQWGIMNRCSCWSTWGFTGLHLPQLPIVEPELMKMIRQQAPWIVFMAVLLQLLFCAGVAWKYWDGVQVFVQRDDGVSNLAWETKKTNRKAFPNDEGYNKTPTSRVDFVGNVDG